MGDCRGWANFDSQTWLKIQNKKLKFLRSIGNCISPHKIRPSQVLTGPSFVCQGCSRSAGWSWWAGCGARTAWSDGTCCLCCGACPGCRKRQNTDWTWNARQVRATVSYPPSRIRNNCPNNNNNNFQIQIEQLNYRKPIKSWIIVDFSLSSSLHSTVSAVVHQSENSETNLKLLHSALWSKLTFA